MRVEALEQRRLLAVSFEFNYLGGNSVGFNDPNEATTFRTALESAASRLGNWLLHDAVIEMDVGSHPFDGTAVATASSVSANSLPSGGFVPALVPAKILGEADFNGADSDGQLDVFFFDSGDVFTYQTDPSQGIADDEIDFQAVMIHELIHAIGFTSATRESGSDDFGNGVTTPGTWSLFDRFLSDVDGNRMIESDPQAIDAFKMDVSANGWPLHSVGGKGPDAGLFFDGPISKQVHGGRVPLFSPTVFSLSSSVAHLDSEGYPNESFVFSPETHTMSSLIVDLEVPQDLTLLEIAMLADIGIMVDARDDIQITWPDPADIQFGTLLDAAQLNASANVPGTFVYDPPSGTMLDAGQAQSLNVSFVPDDLAVSSPLVASSTINVSQAEPVITWPAAESIVYGTLLGDSQLRATANVPGTFVYDPLPATRLNPGTGQQLGVTFHPDNTNFAEVSSSITIDVLPSSEFRTLDGSHSNLDNVTLGSPGLEQLRQTTVAYQDGISEPRGSDPSSLANPRAISNAVHAQSVDHFSKQDLSAMVFSFGQFLDHDIVLTPGSGEPFFIPVPLGDPQFDPFATGAMVIPFGRSDYSDTSGTDVANPRQQINELTSFVDGSVIYGSDDGRAGALRAGQGGQMIMRTDGLLPINGVDTPFQPNDVNGGADPSTLFVSGDIRANEQIGLTAMHTLFAREHNYWAARIAAEQYPGEDLSDPAIDEAIYQQARRVVAAELQIITYNEFLPMMLGEDSLSEYQGYDGNIDPRISNVFAGAAFRVGHTMLPNELYFVDENGTITETRPLANAFFRPQVVIDNGIEPILRGLAKAPQQEVDRFVVDGVRNLLFGPPGAGGFDLASLNIQRGRDHGLPTYNQVRIDFGLAPATSFADISSDLETQTGLASAYASVDDVDIWVGGLCEDHVAGRNLGETFSTIWIDQFERLRDGDRYFYLNQNWETGLLEELEGTRMSDIMLRNTEIDFLAENVFRVAREDFGDAPFDFVAPRYPTLRMDNGPRHIVGDLHLGETIDAEPDGQPSNLADGDGSDEDGIIQFLSPITDGDQDTGASLRVISSAEGMLDAWIDFNRDGDFDELGEKIIDSAVVTAGETLIGYSIPAGAHAGDLVSRFRLSTRGNLEPTGPSHDGEVEDHLINVLDGNQNPDVVVAIPSSHVTVSSDSTNVRVHAGPTELFRAPLTSVGSLTLNGGDDDETVLIDLSGAWVMSHGPLVVDGGGGANRLAVTGPGTLDLSSDSTPSPSGAEGENASVALTAAASRFETLDLLSPDASILRINAAAIAALAESPQTVRIVAGEGDVIDVTDAIDWRMTAPIVDDGDFLLTAGNSLGPSSKTIEALTPHMWQNFLQKGDVNNDGEVTAGDVLRIINELDRRDFSDRISSDLMDPATVVDWPGVYFDHSGDDRATALDALQIINFLTRQAQGGSAEQVSNGPSLSYKQSKIGSVASADPAYPGATSVAGDRTGDPVVDTFNPTFASGPDHESESASEQPPKMSERIDAVDYLLANHESFESFF